ncbi:MAG: glycosyltransferase, partial [Gemmatimonadales bacterium]
KRSFRSHPSEGMKLVIQNTSSVWGGNEKWLANVAGGLVSRGHDVVVSCKRGPVHDGLRKSGIRTTNFRPRGSIDFGSGLSFAAWLTRHKPDALLLTSWHSLSWSTWAAGVAKIPRVVIRLGIVREFAGSGPRSSALRSVNTIIANSEEIRDSWNRTAPPNFKWRVKVVMNGIEARAFDRPAARAKLRTELGISDSALLIGGAGHLFPRKGFDYLLRAFASAAIPDSHVAIAGDGDHLPALKQLAAKLGIEDRVHWLGHRDNGPEIVAGLDLFVLSSHNEGMANVMLEAMAGGTPVIASDISGVRKAIGASEDRPVAGWIVPPADDAALSAELAEVAALIRTGSEEVDRRVGEASWRIENWFTMSRMVDECEAILFP